MPDVVGLLAEVADIGRDPAGGYRRFALTDADASMSEWFDATAHAVGLDVEVDGNGNRWAWWGDPAQGNALVAGSHLDSVPRGGAFDGPLGVASSLAAVAALREQGVQPTRPVAVVCFAEEEGGRFGIACMGSRLLTGAISAERALALRDEDGTTMAEPMTRAGRDPRIVGADPQRIARIGDFVELHVEQGRGLIDLDRSVAVGTRIWPHGQWRLEIAGRADHAGTARMGDRDDPMATLARFIQVARQQALDGDSPARPLRATIGRLRVTPNAINAVPASVTAWLDARAGDEASLLDLIDEVERQTGAALVEESRTPEQRFHPDLVRYASAVLDDAPLLESGAGHDAGILADAGVRSVMLFVRNPTGVSHSPEEHAEDADARRGVEALTRLLASLASDS